MGTIVEKQNLDQLADYQKGSVVSKSLLAKKSGNITLFAFDQGEGLSEHTAPYDAYVQILDGKVDITISGTVYTLSAGEIIVMPANEPHALQGIEAFKMLLVMIKSE